MEISNEMRAAIYHVYHTAQVAGKPYIGYSEFSEEQQNKTLIGNIKYLDKEGAHVVHADVHGNPWNEITFYNYGECQLLLTPLSSKSITDEHIEELWALLGLNPDFGNNPNYPNEKSKKQYIVEWFTRGKGFNQYERFTFQQSEILISFLRSKSYHVPYMGIDLFEAGIAVIKSEGDKK